MILLVHSCPSREWLWKHWRKYFDHCGWEAEVRFITGEGHFSDELKKTLEEITDEYIWYTLDDFIILEAIDWERYEKMAIELKADAVRLQPNVGYDARPYRFYDMRNSVSSFYRMDKHGELLKQKFDSAYIMSMQTSIWRREYFLESLTPGLDPWELEITSPKLGDIYFVPRLPFWYIDIINRGIPTSRGIKIIKNTDVLLNILR